MPAFRFAAFCGPGVHEPAPGSEMHGSPAEVKAAAASFVGVHDEV